MKYILSLGVCLISSNVWAEPTISPPAPIKPMSLSNQAEISKQASAGPENIRAKSEAVADEHHWQGSLMFNDKELKWLQDAIKSHDLNIPLDVLLPGMFTRESQKKSLSKAQGLAKVQEQEDKKIEPVIPDMSQDTTLYIYLNSIAYISKQDWLLWLDSKKVTPLDNDPLFEIIEVTSDKVILRWTNFPIDKLAADWQENLIPLNNPGLLSNGKNLVINKDTKVIAFVLKPNQTFVGYKLNILEGKVTPQKIEASGPKVPPLPPVENPKSEDSASLPEPVSESNIAMEQEALKIEKAKQRERLEQLKKHYQDQLTMLSTVVQKPTP